MLRFHNSLTRRVEPFEPLDPPKVKVYNCGPTVYSSPHIGNYRAFVFTDLLRRYLDFRGYDVTQVMNLTDVGHLRDDGADAGEDRMALAARKEKLDPWKIAEKYTAEFFAGLDLLNVRRAHHYPRATDHVAEMIEIIEGLIEKGHAYVVDHDVYFDVSSFERYGALSGNTADDALVEGASERVSDEVRAKKRSPRDFALWKSDAHHIMQWDSPWGRGFPGWHIECSAMSRKYLGDTIDIHTGGIDNTFPHHECEIAQSEAFSGQPFVRTWLHVAHLNLSGEKMSKSEGNVLVPQDLVDEGFTPAQVRYYLLSVHYRQPMTFSREALKGSAQALDRLRNLLDSLTHKAAHGSSDQTSIGVVEAVDEARARFVAALDDDLNASLGLAALFELMNALNQRSDLSRADADVALRFLREIDEVLGVFPRAADAALDQEIEAKIAAREEARRARDFETADRIRDELARDGIELLDTPEGLRWRRR
ncbi:MAG: cysteine--tRNA ligase [Planctomycetota bacterium JB042]